MTKDTGGQAFPLLFTHATTKEGMTLRDYLAAKAMQASRSRNSEYRTWDDLAQDSYDIADAMLKAREK